MKLAIVTPLPPQHTGIADYAADLSIGLKKNGFKIDLFSNIEITSYKGINVFNVEKTDLNILNEYDLIIYQMGNNSNFHSYMFELIKKYKGIVHLHDVVLHHTLAWLTFAQDNRNDYFRIIEKWYGVDVKALTKVMVDMNRMPWENKIVTDIPLFEEFVQYADACIVHSDFVKEKINAVFPKLDIYKIDQLYDMNVCRQKQTDKIILKFGVFGGVDPQKKVDIVLKTFENIKNKNLNTEFYLIIVGGVDKQCKSILDLPKKYNLEDNVKITGRVNENEFMEYFLDIDVLIALRYPTMGETSAVVMRAMQLGIPCIVNDVGWYSELPEHVKKVPIDHLEDNLEKIILEILNNKNSLKNLKEQALIYSKDDLDFDKYIDGYSYIIRKVYSHNINKNIYKQLAAVMDDLKCADNPAVFAPVIKRLMGIF